MKILLDTHTLLWFIEGDDRMSVKVRQIIEDGNNDVVISVASLFEVAIKLKIGKLALRNSLAGFMADVEKALIGLVPIEHSHLMMYQDLPDLPDHRDPFDRLIIATSIAEGAAVVTTDPKFKKYDHLVEVIW